MLGIAIASLLILGLTLAPLVLGELGHRQRVRQDEDRARFEQGQRVRAARISKILESLRR